jgi:hypothetical protein
MIRTGRQGLYGGLGGVGKCLKRNDLGWDSQLHSRDLDFWGGGRGGSLVGLQGGLGDADRWGQWCRIRPGASAFGDGVRRRRLRGMYLTVGMVSHFQCAPRAGNHVQKAGNREQVFWGGLLVEVRGLPHLPR